MHKTTRRNPVNLHAPKITQEMCVAAVAAGIRHHTADQRHAAKRFARSRGHDPRAFEDWQRGITAPRMAALIALMAEYSEVERRVLELLEIAKVGKNGEASGSRSGD